MPELNVEDGKDPTLGVEFDVHFGQLTLRSSQLQALGPPTR